MAACAPRGAIVGTASSAGADQGPRGTVVTANMTAHTASVVDVATGALLATYPTGTGPHEVAVSNDGRWALVSVYGNRDSIGHSLLVLDLTAQSAPRKIELGALRRPHGMRFLPDNRRFVVTSEVTQRVGVVDFARGTVDTTISTGQPASHMIVVTADGARAFTTNISAGTVSELDLRRLALVRTITVGTRIEGIAVTPDGREVWVGANDGKAAIVVDVAAGAVAGRVEGFGFPYRLGITPDGATAVISDPGAERIRLVDVRARTIRATIEPPPLAGAATALPGAAGPSPQGVTLSGDGRFAFVTLKAAAKVAVVDIRGQRIVKLLDVGGGSDGVGYSPLVVKR